MIFNLLSRIRILKLEDFVLEIIPNGTQYLNSIAPDHFVSLGDYVLNEKAIFD